MQAQSQTSDQKQQARQKRGSRIWIEKETHCCLKGSSSSVNMVAAAVVMAAVLMLATHVHPLPAHDHDGGLHHPDCMVIMLAEV